jgi:hypothetical protein
MQRWARAVILAAVVVGCVLFLPFLRPSLQGSNALQAQAVRYDAKDGDLAMDGPSQHLEAEEPDGRNIDNIREDYRLARGSNGGEQAANSSRLTQRHTERQQAVVEMFRHAWKGYTQFAWGKDELLPLTKKGTTSYGMGLTIIDSLDTMWLMGLTEEFQKARDWVAQSLDIAGNHREVSLFETNIRVLGGLLAAYHLSNDGIFLEKAVELGDRFLPAFKTPTGIPYGTVVLNKDSPKKTSKVACISELGTLQLEMRDLSHSTGDSKYQAAADRALDVVQSHMTSAIATQEVYIESGVPKQTEMSVGARTDSYYEYLIKQWVQSGKNEEKIREWYERAANAIISKLIKYSRPNHMAFPAKLYSPDRTDFRSSMDHLSCFLPGMLALGYLHGFPKSHLDVARNLTHTCYQLYHQSPSGLSPEEVIFYTHPLSVTDFNSVTPVYMLRPETVESLFVLHRVTRDSVYQEWGWEILQALKKHCRVPSGGYTTLRNVNSPAPKKTNKMESFFLAETLKYLFLLFADDDNVLALDRWVFNTEAHPLPVWTS